MTTYTTRSVKCPCGSIDYSKTVMLHPDRPSTPIWCCINCLANTPRTTRRRKANWQVAMDRWNEIVEAAKKVDLGYGKLCSLYWHQDKLSDSLTTKKISRRDITYHYRGAMKIINGGSES